MHIRFALTFALVACALQAAGAAEVPEPAPGRRAELVNLVRQDCGSCHGMSLRGGLGPPLLPQSLRGQPSDLLVLTVLYGRGGTAMAGWQPFLSADEAAWIVERLKSGFPELVP
ncbi:MAG: cytochrome c [Rhodocyclaceae bacterium]|nr:cytochrome c [Rhodocyclaceae bacterium]